MGSSVQRQLPDNQCHCGDGFFANFGPIHEGEIEVFILIIPVGYNSVFVCTVDQEQGAALD